MQQNSDETFLSPKDSAAISLIVRRRFDEAYAIDTEDRLILSGILDQIFVRSGKCNQCGSCCNNAMLMINGQAITTRDEFENLCLQKPEYRKWVFKEMKDGKMFFACSMITKENTCGDYSNRFYICKAYPNSGSLIPEHCGYRLAVKLGKGEITNPQLILKVKAQARKVGLLKETMIALYPDAFNPLGAIKLLIKATKTLLKKKFKR